MNAEISHAEIWDAVVIGGGPAGLSAALMLGRARRRVLVIDSGSPRNRFAERMHGVLGDDGTPPTELLRRGKEEVSAYGVEIRQGSADRVHETPDGLTISLAEAAPPVKARTLIVTTGLRDELPDVPGLAERWGASVLHCPYCHGWEVADRRLAVLTTSPLGLHQAELVRQWSDRVTVFTAAAGDLDAAQQQRLRSRGIRLVAAPVVEVVGEGDEISFIRTAEGEEIPVDAVFTAGAPHPHDAFLSELELERNETPFGSFLAVDPMGRTSSERIWAAGNVVNPGANVPMSIGAGALVGGAVNAALVSLDFDSAEAVSPVQAAGADVQLDRLREQTSAALDPREFWEHRYGRSGRIWSGRVNAVLAEIAAQLEPGSALDLGCGEGADAIWLAEHGWITTGIDISRTAVDRARAAAEKRGVPEDRCRFECADLTVLDSDERFTLVAASYFQSPVRLARGEILRRAASLVAPGGHLLVTAHTGAPSWAEGAGHDRHDFRSPDAELAELALPADLWTVVAAEVRTRSITAPDGTPATIDDSVVLARRRAEGLLHGE